jgi:NADPH2:quinone reductase
MNKTYGKYVVNKTGAPEVLEWTSEEFRQSASNEVRVRNEAVGVDFIDTMIRSGQLPTALPAGIGFAGVGIVEDLGTEVRNLSKGDRVAYMYFVGGSYAEQRYVPADRVFKLPDQSLSPVIAAGALFRGLTAWYLATRLRDLKQGDTVLVHAAAGGVGLILVQWLTHLGVKVVGTVHEKTKVSTLLTYGCHYPVVIPEEDFAAKVKEVSDGKGATVVYESIGAATFGKSLDCAGRFGLIVSYGWPSGDPGEVSLMTLRNKGSLFITRPTVTHYTAEPADFRCGATELFRMIKEGNLRIHVEHKYPLSQAAKAHEDIVAGKTVGSVVLVV